MSVVETVQEIVSLVMVALAVIVLAGGALVGIAQVVAALVETVLGAMPIKAPLQ